MIETRVFIDSLNNAQKFLNENIIEPVGEYEIIDTVYKNVDGTPLADDFLRLREVPKNIWDEKPFILAVKQTKPRTIGKNSDIPLKLQFDTRDEAEAYYNEYLSDLYVKDFSFQRIGWQHIMPNHDVVDLEIIEDTHPSIEFKSDTDEGLRLLLAKFAIHEDMLIKGPTVEAVREILNSIN